MKFYQLTFISAILLFFGCSSKHQEQSEQTKHTIHIEKNSSLQQTKAILKIDQNSSIIISKDTIQIPYCKNKKFIIINIFAPWFKNSIYQIKSMDKLSSDNICIISIAIDSDSNLSLLDKYQISHKVIFDLQNNKFVDTITKIIHIDKNFKLPISLIYKNHKYINNYQGIIPIEMLKHIIKDQ